MSAGSKAQRGFTYMAFLLFIAVAGAGLAAYGELASHAAQREKEAELLFRGEQYRDAIASYYKKEQRYPAKLADLVEDKRYPMPVHHLRRLYKDPVTGGDFGMVEAPGGGVMGVFSRSEEEPVKTVRRSTFDLREALSRGGLPRSTPYDRGRHVQADDHVCVVHLRRALRPAARAEPYRARRSRGRLAHEDRVQCPLVPAARKSRGAPHHAAPLRIGGWNARPVSQGK